jgi:hypothetical protein
VNGNFPIAYVVFVHSNIKSINWSLFQALFAIEIGFAWGMKKDKFERRKRKNGTEHSTLHLVHKFLFIHQCANSGFEERGVVWLSVFSPTITSVSLDQKSPLSLVSTVLHNIVFSLVHSNILNNSTLININANLTSSGENAPTLHNGVLVLEHAVSHAKPTRQQLVHVQLTWAPVQFSCTLEPNVRCATKKYESALSLALTPTQLCPSATYVAGADQFGQTVTFCADGLQTGSLVQQSLVVCWNSKQTSLPELG